MAFFQPDFSLILLNQGLFMVFGQVSSLLLNSLPFFLCPSFLFTTPFSLFLLLTHLPLNYPSPLFSAYKLQYESTGVTFEETLVLVDF